MTDSTSGWRDSARNLFNGGLETAEVPVWRLRRVRVINISLLLLIAIGSLYAIRFFRIGAMINAIGACVAIAICIAAMLVLRWGGSVVLAGNLGAAAVLIAGIVSVAAGGGYEHRTLGWLYVVPLAAGLLAGVGAGIFWGLGAFAAATSFWWIHFQSGGLVSQIPPEQLQRQGLLEITGVFLAIGVLTITFVRQQKRNQKRMVEALDALEEEVHARKRAETQARAASQEKSRFLATMSHELRTPLNSVIGFSNLMLTSKTKEARDQDLYLERIRDNGVHLLSLINDILDISKIEAGRVDVSYEPVSIGRLIDEAVAATASLALEKDLEITTEVPPILNPLVGDERRLKQVLINLIGNAIRFTDKGTVTVRVRSEPDSNQPAGLEVVDTGIGIPQDELSKIFEPFRQVDDGSTRTYQGSGLGLAIARSLCELMGFELGAESQAGHGSTFRVLFKPQELPLRDAGEAAPSPASNRRRVLVIDDDPDSRLLLTEYIGSAGYEVLTAESGDQGLETARRELPDLITLDLVMPGLSGWAVLDRLRRDPELGHIPVVVVSIVAGENRGAVLGAVGKITKPFDSAQLAATLEQALGSD